MLSSKQCDEVLRIYHEQGHAAANRVFLRLMAEDRCNVVQWLARAAGELSAIGHGRTVDQQEALKISAKLRELYE